MQVCFYGLGEVDNALLKFAVIVSRHGGKWVYCKHRERKTWEIPGGHREPGEQILETAKRELHEETGAVKFDLTPICVYSVKRETQSPDNESFGLLCIANITEFQPQLESEIEKIAFFEREPENLTYPEIQPALLAKVQQAGYSL